MNRAGIAARAASWLGATLLVVALAGCAAATGAGSGQDITGNWRLVSGTDATGDITPGKAVVTLTIDGDSSGGHGPCNSFGATTAATTTGTISIVVGIHTEMACVDAELNTTESRYFAALGTVTRASLEKKKLTLAGDGDMLVFTKATQ
jgi:heat shock protein HslJ